jgi:hypothetical protein
MVTDAMENGSMFVDAEGPSLSELREAVAERLLALGGEYTAEEERVILDRVAFAIYMLATGDHGRLIYLTDNIHPATWVMEDHWLDAIASYFRDIVAAVRAHIDRWFVLFHRDGWHRTQFWAYRDAVADTVVEAFGGVVRNAVGDL